MTDSKSVSEIVVVAAVGLTAFSDDADVSDSITYSLDDNDGGRFAIDSSTGIVTVAGAIDREIDGASRNITVRADFLGQFVPNTRLHDLDHGRG